MDDLDQQRDALDWTDWGAVLKLAEDIAASGEWCLETGESFARAISAFRKLTPKLDRELDAAVARGLERAAER